MSSLVDPPFAKDPPVKVNVNAKTLGLVLLILGAIGILIDALALIGIAGFCTSYAVSIYGSGCGFPILWLLGDLIGLAAVIIGTIGAYRMYQGNSEGKLWVIYGLIIGLAGAVITLIGNLAAYSGLIGVGAGGGVIIGLIFDLIIYFIIYYLVVISRYPGEAPLSTHTGTSTWSGGGPSAPPPPPAV